MTMTMVGGSSNGVDDLVSKLGDDEIQRVDVSAVAVLNRSEIEAQLDAAHRYPRSMKRFLVEAIGMATISEEVAESCIYSVPREGKQITGPSVRIAEICASAYGNLQIGTRVVDTDETTVTAQGVAWDMERNMRVTIEIKRRITGKSGKRFSEDMIILTGNAAAAIAKRNAIFNVVPRAYVNEVYSKARNVAVGNSTTMTSRRMAVFANFQKLGVTSEQVLAKVGKPSIEDIDLEALETLIGIGTAIRDGSTKIDDVFGTTAAPPAPVGATEEGRRISLRGKQEPTASMPGVEPGAPPPPAADPADAVRLQPASSATEHRQARQTREDSPTRGRLPRRQPDPQPGIPFGDQSQETRQPAAAAPQASAAPPAATPAEPRPEPPRDWNAVAEQLWRRAEHSINMQSLDIIAQDIDGYAREGMPLTLIMPVKSQLEHARKRIAGPTAGG